MRRTLVIARALARPGLLLGSIALLGIGASGALAAAFSAAVGHAFVAGDLPDVTYTAERCRQLLQLAPGSSECEAAAVAHHLDEIVFYRLACGVVGLVGLAFVLLLMRTRDHQVRLLPDRFVPTIGASLFGIAGAILALDSADRLVQSVDAGAGGSLSGAIVCLVIAAVMAADFVRQTPLPECGDDPGARRNLWTSVRASWRFPRSRRSL